MQSIWRAFIVSLIACGAILIMMLGAKYAFPRASAWEIVGSIMLIPGSTLSVIAVLRARSTTDADLKRRAYVYAAKALIVGLAGLAMILFSDYLS